MASLPPMPSFDEWVDLQSESLPVLESQQQIASAAMSPSVAFVSTSVATIAAPVASFAFAAAPASAAPTIKLMPSMQAKTHHAVDRSSNQKKRKFRSPAAVVDLDKEEGEEDVVIISSVVKHTPPQAPVASASAAAAVATSASASAAEVPLPKRVKKEENKPAAHAITATSSAHVAASNRAKKEELKPVVASAAAAAVSSAYRGTMSATELLRASVNARQHDRTSATAVTAMHVPAVGVPSMPAFRRSPGTAGLVVARPAAAASASGYASAARPIAFSPSPPNASGASDASDASGVPGAPGASSASVRSIGCHGGPNLFKRYGMNADIYGLIASNLTGCEYAHFVSTSRLFQPLKQVARIPQNAVYNTMRMLGYSIGQRRSLFVTGEAGVGKTYNVVKLLRAALKRNLKIYMTASTGRACVAFATLQDDTSTNAEATTAAGAASAGAASNDAATRELTQCTTFHSFGGLGKGTTPLEAVIAKLDAYQEKHGPGSYPKSMSRWKDADIVILDEISMLGLRVWEIANLIAQRVRGNQLPFGGLQLVVVGDFLQLPPVADKFVFTHPLWQQLNFACVYLTHVFRQGKDRDFALMLGRIRWGRHTDADLEILHEMARKYTLLMEERKQWTAQQRADYALDVDRTRPLHFEPRHKDCNRINVEQFEAIPHPFALPPAIAEDSVLQQVPMAGGKVQFIETHLMTVAQALERIGKHLEFRVPQTIEWKEGAQYMLTRNIDVKQGQINGALCRMTRAAMVEVINDTDGAQAGPAQPAVQWVLMFKNGSFISLEKTMTTHMQAVWGPGAERLFFRRRQFALRPGYALTIHASQGMTVDQAVLNASSIPFAAGVYVGLSRATTLAGVQLSGFDAKSIKVDRNAIAFCTALRAAHDPTYQAPPPPAANAAVASERKKQGRKRGLSLSVSDGAAATPSSTAAAAAAAAVPAAIAVPMDLTSDTESEEDDEEYKPPASKRHKKKH